jgi:hypothetical protein
MIAHAQLLTALVAGTLAGLVFLLLGRWLMSRRSVGDSEPTQAPLLQPRAVVTQDYLSPEAQAFIKALQSHKEPPAKPSEDAIWAVNIWDTRQPPDGVRGLPH